MKNLFSVILLTLLFACSDSYTNTENPSSKEVEPEPKVMFLNIQDGDTVYNPIKIKMGAVGIEVQAAGVSRIGYGHHHILLNREGWGVNRIILLSDTIFHYPKGETEGVIELKPGNHKLTLQFGDGIHQSYGKELSSSINIVVKKGKKQTRKKRKQTAVKKTSKDVLTNSAYFNRVKANYEKDIYSKLNRPEYRADMIIRYYTKVNDKESVYALRKLGIYIHERPSDELFTNESSNTIFYGDSIARSDIEIIAMTLIESGIKLKAIVQSKYHDTWKSNSLEIGFYSSNARSKSLTLSDIRKKWGKE
jgi:hypothetical protein